MKLIKKAAIAIATGSMIFSNFAPIALADLDLEISGNGAGSDNTVILDSTTTNVVTQTNDADISNNIDVHTSTGGNEANKNTGGDVAIKTGDASSSVEVSNNANSNSAEVSSCGSCLGDLTGKISGNGADSTNSLAVDVESTNYVTQVNEADVKNDVSASSNSGDNEANKNTGGDVTIETGDASVDRVSVSTSVNANQAKVGNNGAGDSGLSLWITGNGADSKNAIALASKSNNIVTQTNDADISNKVSVYANSGDNEAKKNTGGDVVIETGDANADVAVDNMANFNMADVEGCCLLSGTAKIGGNGAYSDNKLGLALAAANFATQENTLDCDRGGRYGYWWYENWYRKGSCATVDVTNETGDNDAKGNTSFNGDPSISTGDADASISVDNSGNANGLTIGGDTITGSEVELPDGFPFDSDGLLGFLMFLFHLS